jgi:hypothetical protein
MQINIKKTPHWEMFGVRGVFKEIILGVTFADDKTGNFEVDYVDEEGKFVIEKKDGYDYIHGLCSKDEHIEIFILSEEQQKSAIRGEDGVLIGFTDPNIHTSYYPREKRK